jgi:c-di-GMP phosphodiesterase
MNEDLIDILDDITDETEEQHPIWRILVVDDDPEVHEATRFALAGVQLLGRQMQLSCANSGAQALALLREDRDFAVILLDVVMEAQDSGLLLVEKIRNELHLDQLRIILRTGQPGYAPELEVFARYDINDYRTKAELNRNRLLTSLCTALRAYEQIHSIAENRRGLELIVQASAELMERHALNTFAEGLLNQISALLGLPREGVVCVQRGSPLGNQDPNSLFVVGAAGRLAGAIGLPLEQLTDSNICTRIQRCMQQGQHLFDRHHSCLYLRSGKHEAVVYLAGKIQLKALDRQLLEVFAANLSACFGNVRLVEQLEYLAYHDSLTGLHNRAGFLLDIGRAGALQHQAIALLDIAHFADLNDGLGHDFGNLALCSLASRMLQQLGTRCCLARISADVFGIIGDEQQVNPEALYRMLDEPLCVAETHLPLQAALGFCRLLEGNENPLIILKRANIALNRAKQSLHSSHEYFIPDMEDNTRWRLEIIQQLRQDFEAGKLAMWYQPQINLSNGQVLGVEALMRWPDGHGGFVQSPTTFIPLAEYSGLILELGEWALHQACQALNQLSQAANPVRRVAVNVSMPQLRQAGFINMVAQAIRRHAITPASLELEITESIAMDEPKVIRRSLEALKRLGLRLAVDDFGTGYSSLSHLRDLPIDCLKIDRCFISEINAGKGGMFAETIIAFAQKLGVSTVAEGVETAEQAGFLRGLGCSEAQGYLYAKPMPLEQLLVWLSERR